VKPVILLLFLTLLLCGCGKQTEMIQTEVPHSSPTVETLQTESGGDTELKLLEAALPDGQTLKLSVLGKQEENTGSYGIREIRVYQDGEWIQTLDMMTAIEKDGVSGIDLGYTESFTLEAAANLKDVNFDGNPDLEICAWCPNNAIPYYYWLWDSESGQFQYAFMLQTRDVDVENQQLIAWYKVENGLYHTEYYRVSDQKELELLKREVEDVRPN